MAKATGQLPAVESASADVTADTEAPRPSGERVQGGAVQRLPLRLALPALLRCVGRTGRLLFTRRIRQPFDHIGQTVHFADGTRAAIYRETAVQGSTVTEPVVLVVGFRLRHVHHRWSHMLFRLESALNTVLFAGFDSFESKLWLRHDENGLYRGIYQWNRRESADAYVRALWWPLALVSELDSIRYMLLPGRYRDALIDSPSESADITDSATSWWRPVRMESTPLGHMPSRRPRLSRSGIFADRW